MHPLQPTQKASIALENESNIFTILKDSEEKLTVSEILERLETLGKGVTDKTVRRALFQLKKKSFVQEYGKARGATVYGISDLPSNNFREDKATINFGGSMVSVEDFLRMLSSLENDPFKLNLKNSVLSEKQNMILRRRMLAVIFSTGSPGYDNALKGIAEALIKIRTELQYVTTILDNFIDSPIWYEQYRDGLAYQMRRVQENDPELYELTRDLIKGE